MHKPKLVLIFLFCLILSSGYVLAKQGEQRAVPYGSTKAPYGFYEYLPQGYDNSTQKYPVVLFFHGSGEKGKGTTSSLPLVLKNGPPMLAKKGKQFPFILISPQSSGSWNTSQMDQLIEYVKANYRVDTERIYITGLSMGGFGVIGYAAKYHDKIAAMVPVASGSTNGSVGCTLAKLPIWAFHNKGDNRVSSNNTIVMINNIKKCGGNPKMTIYPVNGHDGWTETYNNQQMWDWFLSHKKSSSGRPVNKAPVVNAGSPITITLPTNSVVLKGSASDSDGSISSWTWSKLSGPSSSNLSGQNTATLTASSLTAGEYIFRLTVKDNGGLTATSDVKVTVNSAANKAPVANAGSPVTITLPTNSVVLKGSASDSDGSISSWAWSKVSGPSSANLSGQTTATLTASSLTAGEYTFRLTVKDNGGLTATSDVKVNVNAAANKAPFANAGSPVTITLPTNSVVLRGSASDSDGSISSWTWSKVSGPAAKLSGDKTSTLTASSLTAGAYTFRLTVKDNGGLSATSDVRVTVNNQVAKNLLPIANAGTNIIVNLPTTSTTLRGSGFDKDGRIVKYAWFRHSGGRATMSNTNQPNCLITDLVKGEFVFRLEVTDDRGGVGVSWVRVSVRTGNSTPPPTNPPTHVASVDYSYFEGTWNTLPNFDAMKAKKIGKLSKIELTPKQKNYDYGFKFETTINVATPGIYKFYLTSDDGSKLWVNNSYVINNDGLHGAIEKTGLVRLDAGTQKIKVFFFQRSGYGMLDFSYEGPDKVRKSLTSSQIVAKGNVSGKDGDLSDEEAISADLNEELTFNSEIKVYPNPFQSQINVALPSEMLDREVLVTLFNESGVKVFDSNMKISGTNSLDFSNLGLKTGFYFLKLQSDGFTKDFKLIKQ